MSSAIDSLKNRQPSSYSLCQQPTPTCPSISHIHTAHNSYVVNELYIEAQQDNLDPSKTHCKARLFTPIREKSWFFPVVCEEIDHAKEGWGSFLIRNTWETLWAHPIKTTQENLTQKICELYQSQKREKIVNKEYQILIGKTAHKLEIGTYEIAKIKNKLIETKRNFTVPTPTTSNQEILHQLALAQFPEFKTYLEAARNNPTIQLDSETIVPSLRSPSNV